ncbi:MULTISPECIES: sugar phosphate isomerase/epimerase [unclassified Modicisalibacter]|uniref:sugar phosphate isomerase/epimerase family protein n=1 Tax=unclassified Modicisalibacter TaxID=2679913 RepID=UPI001CCC1B2F|nr:MULTISPECIES: sugar phosphate isomerase/epimerase [unclassified Modicisalibacter]MBZ9557791.1 sugar phosphate isomerase/epimerase [Modicisalibacter sp. R2A 31.J]MBZ9573544.1 sugar phosphate isomerase/epimerase [Modicisalibacter sp. MOD 31.J]
MTERLFSLAALTVLELSPPEMVEVAARAGYDRVGLRLIPATPEEHHFPLVADPGLRRRTRQRLRDTGIAVLDVEILRLTPQTDVGRDFTRVLDVGAELGASEVLVAGNDDDGVRLADNFAALCDLASGVGLHPHLEFMPWTGVRDLDQARRIIAAVNRPNAGLLVDAFHFDRSGSRLDALGEVPRRWMRYAQLCDVAGPRPDTMAAIIHEARQARCFPGEGDIDLIGLLAVLPDDVPLSLEIPTQALRDRGVSALERARSALESSRRLVSTPP